MTATTYIQQQIRTCRNYEQNGLPDWLKNELKGQRRTLEYLLDKTKAEQRQNTE